MGYFRRSERKNRVDIQQKLNFRFIATAETMNTAEILFAMSFA
jgi:hypothetical protein